VLSSGWRAALGIGTHLGVLTILWQEGIDTIKKSRKIFQRMNSYTICRIAESDGSDQLTRKGGVT
jgi:hypothetical protein